MAGDTFVTRNAGAVGPNATALNTTITENHNNASLSDVDLSALAPQLGLLKQAMKAEAEGTSQFKAAPRIFAAVARAQQANRPTPIARLKAAGNWAFETATKIGVSVAAEALKNALGMR